VKEKLLKLAGGILIIVGLVSGIEVLKNLISLTSKSVNYGLWLVIVTIIAVIVTLFNILLGINLVKTKSQKRGILIYSIVLSLFSFWHWLGAFLPNIPILNLYFMQMGSYVLFITAACYLISAVLIFIGQSKT
jgi:hypothetical protein